ncbi:MAG: phosphodiesterase, partial [Gallionellales bacterium CG_4_8_14_3_um_filter_54_18]
MIKRIAVEQLRLGMFIHELGCAWMDHPFWRKTFLLDEPKDLQIILSAQIKWI